MRLLNRPIRQPLYAVNVEAPVGRIKQRLGNRIPLARHHFALADLADELIKDGHEVSVICSRHAYEHPRITYPPSDNYNGVKIKRLKNPDPGTPFYKRCFSLHIFLMKLKPYIF